MIPYRLNYRVDNTSSSGSSRTSSIASDVQPVTEKMPRDATRPPLSRLGVNCTPKSTPWYISTYEQGTDADQPTRKLLPRCVFSTPRSVKVKEDITRLKCKSLSTCTSVGLLDRQGSLSYSGGYFTAREFVVENTLPIPKPVPCFQDPDGVQLMMMDLQGEKERSGGLSEEETKERADSARLPRIKQRNVAADDISPGKISSHKEAHTITESVHLCRDTKKIKQNQAPRYLENTSENFGPTSYFQNTKIKFLGDLLMPPDKGEDSKPTEMSDHHNRQRITQQFVRRENIIRSKGTLFSEEDEKAWLEMVNMQVINHSDYDRFASKRRPSILEGVEVPCPESRPRNGADFQLTHPMNGKAYPIFFKDGKPMRKFGHAASMHKHSKLREGSVTSRYI